MSYEPTNWKSGDTITSAKLNKLENGLAEASGGGGGGVLIIGMTAEAGTLTLDKTWQEIYDHMSAGGQAMVFKVSTLADNPFVQQVIASSCEGFPSDSEYYVVFYDTTFPQFSATSPSGYPSASL